MATTTLQSPDKYDQRIEDAFQKMYGKPLKEAIIQIVRNTVRDAEIEEATEKAVQKVVVEDDLIK